MSKSSFAFFRAASIVAAALFLAPASQVAAQTTPKQYMVNMAQMRFGTIPVNLKVGDTIVWVNKDTVLHTVTARDRSFDIRIAPGKRATQTLTKAGNISIYCIYHPAMRGTLKVAS